jgi:HK97 family phage prohead protease
MQNRAYSVLEVRAFDDKARKFSGVATTPTVDRVGDIIDPLGVKFQNPLPFLWQHNHDQPVGTVNFDKPTAKGINFDAQLVHPDEVESQTLKDLLQLAWDSIKTKLVRATSIGFRPIEYSFMDNGGIHFTETEVYELSGVTIPANSDALISTIKSLDAAARRAAGVPDPEIPSPPEPAAIGKSCRVVRLNDPAGVSAPPFIINTIKRNS